MVRIRRIMRTMKKVLSRGVPLVLDSAVLWAEKEEAAAEVEEEQQPETKVQAQVFYSWFSKLHRVMTMGWATGNGATGQM
jgi:hypothetical protein